MSEIWGLIPAAGSSRRMGTDKRLLGVGTKNQPMLERVITLLKKGGIRNIMLVLEADSPCAFFAEQPGVHLAINREPKDGMLSSIWAGIDALPESATSIAVTPGDKPLLSPRVIEKATEAHRANQNSKKITLPSFGEKGGHPLLISRSLFHDIKSCPLEQGLKTILRTHENLVQRVLFSANNAKNETDVDTPKDYQEIEAHLKTQES